MQLAKKKALAAKVLKVGKNRVVFAAGHESEIKEAITRQDILDLHKSGAIRVREVKGRRAVQKRKHRRRTGKIKKKVNQTKQDYVKLTRKLRKFAGHLLKTKEIDKDKHREIRKRIRAKKFRSRRHLNESLGEI
ncbi:hypothetical protein CMI37_26790 [Candidatus Pacearchaeota archaeon]|nr:hypothetical protein [Candidatus Pacearchaeota archaeon]|tara:strand:+ start:6395 stop:6796 length:402 start_codon:yes stop_codon:yes gene_type:complete